MKVVFEVTAAGKLGGRTDEDGASNGWLAKPACTRRGDTEPKLDDASKGDEAETVDAGKLVWLGLRLNDDIGPSEAEFRVTDGVLMGDTELEVGTNNDDERVLFGVGVAPLRLKDTDGALENEFDKEDALGDFSMDMVNGSPVGEVPPPAFRDISSEDREGCSDAAERGNGATAPLLLPDPVVMLNTEVRPDVAVAE
jgi:hypothetical protein